MPFRTRLLVPAGTLVGAALSAWVWYAERAAVAGGASASGAGYGASHLLFVGSLPWSVPVWAAAVLAGWATGADGPGLLPPFFYAMPLVAGACWGWLSSGGRRRPRLIPPPVVGP